MLQASRFDRRDHLSAGAVAIREPCAEDGPGVHQLIAACPPLDRNSLYCNLLQCSHFATTSAIATRGGTPLAFVSGHRMPKQPHTLFVWQVAVAPAARGQGLAGRLMQAILGRRANRDIADLEATITADNAASWSLFTGLARTLGAPLLRRVGFDRERHLDGSHASEILIAIGPFGNRGQVALINREGRKRA